MDYRLTTIGTKSHNLNQHPATGQLATGNRQLATSKPATSNYRLLKIPQNPPNIAKLFSN
jgi:hypothetical protein